MEQISEALHQRNKKMSQVSHSPSIMESLAEIEKTHGEIRGDLAEIKSDLAQIRKDVMSVKTNRLIRKAAKEESINEPETRRRLKEMVNSQK